MRSLRGVQVVHRPGILSAEIDGEVVLYDGDTGRGHLLSASGSVLWPALSRPVTVGELAEDVADVFEVPVSEAAAQLEAFFQQLLDMDVLQVVEPDPSAP